MQDRSLTMATSWADIGRRIVQGLDARMGELILVRECSGRYDVLQEILLAIEEAGAVPMPQISPARYLERLWGVGTLTYLSRWDHRRADMLETVDRVLVLGGDAPDIDGADRHLYGAWAQAEERLTQIEDHRRLPHLMVAVPTAKRAFDMGITLDALDARVLPALNVPAHALSGEITRVLAAVQNALTLTVRAATGHELTLKRGSRRWVGEDGCIDQSDRARGAVVSMLPAGSLSCAPLEDLTEGNVYLPRLHGARDVTLHVNAGRIVHVDARTQSEQTRINGWLDGFHGEPRRVGCVGIGLNPGLSETVGWPQVDACAFGRVSVTLGDNRHLGGSNASSLSLMLGLERVTLLADGVNVLLGTAAA